MKKSTRFALLSLFALTLSMLAAPRALAWRFDSHRGRAEPMVIDAAGDVIVGGRVLYGGEVFKLSGKTGQVMWQFNTSHASEQLVSALAVDSHGDVFVAFSTIRSVTKLSGATGARLWTKPVGGSVAGCQSHINSMAVDRDDDVVTAGTAGCLFNVAKLDGLMGDEVWHYEREGYGKAVAVDPFGDVAAAGLMNRNFASVKLRGDSGEEIWQREVNGAGNFSDVFEEANAVAMDKDGSVVVVGSTSNEIGNPRDFTVARYLPDGSPHWTQIVDGRYRATPAGTDQSEDVANTVVIDKDGGVIAAGSVQECHSSPCVGGEPQHFRVVKFSRDGDAIWSRPAEDPISAGPDVPEYQRGYGFSLAVNAFGNVVAGGVHNGRFTLVKFWGRTGGRAWRRQLASGIDVTLNGNNALSVAMDASSDVIAAGETLGADGLDRFTVVKLRRVDGLDSDDAPAPAVPETVSKYAPLVYLHSNDAYRPGDPMTFIRGSALRWSHQSPSLRCGDYTDAERGEVDAARLGQSASLPYVHWPRINTENSCDLRTNIPPLAAYEHTRPFDGSERHNVLGQEEGYLREGYYLDPDDEDNELRAGIGVGAPVFYEYVPRKYVAYWFFYPYNEFRLENPQVGSSFPIQSHEGDWERVSIQLDAENLPVNIFFYGHSGGLLAHWSTIHLYDGTHPIVFSAKGGHASYPEVGEYNTELCVPFRGCALDRTDAGMQWRTWDNLLKVESQPWYGFGGAWGEVGELPAIGELSGSHWTGPLGPSPYKTSQADWPDRIPPQLNMPANVTVNANTPQGAAVHYSVTATDNSTLSPRVTCSPQSGSLFPVGTTTVACTAADGAGNTAEGTFKITVKGAATQLSDLTTLVKDFNLPNGMENSLVAKLQSALAEAEDGRACVSSNKLKAFVNEVRAQSGKKLSPTQAEQMLTTADRIRAVLGCA